MSHYRKILTSLVKVESLVQSLAALGIQAEFSSDRISPTLKLSNNYDKDQAVAILVKQEALKSAGLLPRDGSWDSSLFGRGYGYRWDDQAGAYEVVQDGMDASKLQRTHDLVAQRYAVIEATQAAWAAGWNVTESVGADGVSVELAVVRSY